MSRGTCLSIEMLKGYMARESLATPAIGKSGPAPRVDLDSKQKHAFVPEWMQQG